MSGTELTEREAGYVDRPREPAEATDLLVTPAMLQAAIQMGAEGRESLRFLLETQREERAAWAERQYAAALAAFQADCPEVVATRTGAHKGTKYADRADVMRAIQPHLTAHGLSLQFIDNESTETGFRTVCQIRHVDGHAERVPFTCPREKASNRMNVSQAEGSASEYAQRYALKLALNFTVVDKPGGKAIDDDDGEAAGSNAPTVTDEQAANLQALAEEVGGDLPGRLLSEYAKVERWADVPERMYSKVVARLERARKAGAAIEEENEMLERARAGE